MKSPFPGMDPYLEAHWGDVHSSIALYARDQLRRQLPADLIARVEEDVAYVGVSELNGESRSYYPDVRVEEFRSGPAGRKERAAIVAVSESVRVQRTAEAFTQRSVRIIEPESGNRIVSVIEILSPANKVGSKGRRNYQRKRRKFLRARTSLVEIDLIRSGRPNLALATDRIPPGFREPYRVCVVRGWRLGEAEMFPVSLRERLPVIKVPLRKKETEAALDLQALLDLAYESGSYERTDYRKAPIPPLNEEDAAWADQLLREKRLR